ncbi:MAG: RsmB/NOP family class I SAM-dependent RNA methyltransferase [Candidatus Nanohalobium sp.]
MEKYKPLIDDWQAFKQQAEKHPLQGLRKNRLKARSDFEDKLSETFDLEESGWNSNVYRVSDETPGKSMLHWRGEYYVQEESAALPVTVLDPQPGEKVLDMCAAPGGKCTQMAARMENKGLIVANDDSAQRMKSLHANVYRTGSKIIEATNYDGRNIPEDEKFDRVLVDAPCSGEGDRYYRNFRAADEGESKGLQSLQKDLLKKAGRLVKEGGTVVYSTCTLTPTENEAVVSEIVEETDLELEMIETEAEHVRGVENFEDECFGEEMQKTVRVYPHHMESGMIYVAKLRKTGSLPEREESECSESSSSNKAEEYMQGRFGVDPEKVNLEKINGDYWLCSDEISGLESETRGIRAVRDMDIGLKPTTYFLQLLQDEVTENIVAVSESDLEDFSENRMIEADLSEKGYVTLRFQDRIIGCGFYMDGLVSNRVPEGRLEELVDTF